MPRIVFIQHDGTEQIVNAVAGRSLMQNAIDFRVAGILGECAGCCNCATCHGYVDPAWLARLPAMAEDEIMMLQGTLDPQANSRLTCQIVMTDALDGIVVRLPASQN